MKDIFGDERGDSALIITIASSILFFGIAYIVFSYAYNTPITILNDMMADNMVSQQTATAWNFMLSIWKATPFFFVIGLIIYSFERSKGTDLSTGAFFSYLFLMIVGIVASSYLVYGVGLAADGFTMAMDNTIFTDISEIWDTSSKRDLLVSAMYYMSMFPALLVSVLFMFHPILKHTEWGMSSTSNEPTTIPEYNTELEQF